MPVEVRQENEIQFGCGLLTTISPVNEADLENRLDEERRGRSHHSDQSLVTQG